MTTPYVIGNDNKIIDNLSGNIYSSQYWKFATSMKQDKFNNNNDHFSNGSIENFLEMKAKQEYIEDKLRKRVKNYADKIIIETASKFLSKKSYNNSKNKRSKNTLVNDV